MKPIWLSLLSARFEFNVPRVIARVNNPKNAWLFNQEMGVDVALNQADILARLVAEEMSLGDMMTLLKLRKGEFSLIEEKVHPLSPSANKNLAGNQICRTNLSSSQSSAKTSCLSRMAIPSC